MRLTCAARDLREESLGVVSVFVLVCCAGRSAARFDLLAESMSFMLPSLRIVLNESL